MTHPLHVTLPSLNAHMGDRAGLCSGPAPGASERHSAPPETDVRDRPRRFLVLGGDSDSNLGDHAILHGLCLALVRWAPDAQITVTSHLSRCQVLGRGIPGVVDVVPRGPKGLSRLLAAALRSERIVLGGGGLLQDDDSRVKMPYWAARLALLATLNGSVTSASLGAGPIRHKESRLWARWAARSLEQVSVRDAFAARSLEAALGRPVGITPDPAFLLPAAAPARARRHLEMLGLQPDRPLIGVSLRHWFHHRGGLLPRRYRHRLGLDRNDGGQPMQACLGALASALRELARAQDAQLLYLPSYPLPHEGDLDACISLSRRLPDVPSAIAVIGDPLLYKALCGQLRLMISARMHPLILSAGMGVPVVGLAYNGKFRGLFDMLGTPPRLIQLEDFRDGSANAGTLVGHAMDALREDRDLAARAQRLAEWVLGDIGRQVARLPGEARASA